MNAQTSMQLVRTIDELQTAIRRGKQAGKTVGFVPTMGFLHEGHLELAAEARKDHDVVVMSIFVNPAQFGPNEDFDAYPRDEKRDTELAKNAGVDYLFVPGVKEMYPRESSIQILPGGQADQLCGASRPGHFDGVLKVILKLFNIVDPDESYFGMKDAQQLAIIETFVQDFNLRTAIKRVATVREEDGLAKSSRNVRLTAEERQQAPVIYRALSAARKSYYEGADLQEIVRQIEKTIEQETSGKVDYVKALSYPALDEAVNEADEIILAAAVQFSAARLIDNIIMSTVKDEEQ